MSIIEALGKVVKYSMRPISGTPMGPKKIVPLIECSI